VRAFLCAICYAPDTRLCCPQARLTGMPTDGGDGAVQAAAAALQARGVANVLVKLGKHGSMLVPPPPVQPLRQPALRAEKVRLCGRDACKYAAHVSFRGSGG
jgi:hypothetical protein